MLVGSPPQPPWLYNPNLQPSERLFSTAGNSRLAAARTFSSCVLPGGLGTVCQNCGWMSCLRMSGSMPGWNPQKAKKSIPCFFMATISRSNVGTCSARQS